MNYAIKVLQKALKDNKREYLRIMASHDTRQKNEETTEALNVLQYRMNELESTINVLNEFATAEVPGA